MGFGGCQGRWRALAACLLAVVAQAQGPAAAAWTRRSRLPPWPENSSSTVNAVSCGFGVKRRSASCTSTWRYNCAPTTATSGVLPSSCLTFAGWPTRAPFWKWSNMCAPSWSRRAAATSVRTFTPYAACCLARSSRMTWTGLLQRVGSTTRPNGCLCSSCSAWLRHGWRPPCASRIRGTTPKTSWSWASTRTWSSLPGPSWTAPLRGLCRNGFSGTSWDFEMRTTSPPHGWHCSSSNQMGTRRRWSRLPRGLPPAPGCKALWAVTDRTAVRESVSLHVCEVYGPGCPGPKSKGMGHDMLLAFPLDEPHADVRVRDSDGRSSLEAFQVLPQRALKDANVIDPNFSRTAFQEASPSTKQVGYEFTSVQLSGKTSQHSPDPPVSLIPQEWQDQACLRHSLADPLEAVSVFQSWAALLALLCCYVFLRLLEPAPVHISRFTQRVIPTVYRRRRGSLVKHWLVEHCWGSASVRAAAECRSYGSRPHLLVVYYLLWAFVVPSVLTCPRPSPDPNPHATRAGPSLITAYGRTAVQLTMARKKAFQRAQRRVLQSGTTRWSQSSEFSNDSWYCIQSSTGSSVGGVLIAVSKSVVAQAQLSHAELCPGRLLHVRLTTDPAIDVLGVYQHTWSPHKASLGPDNQLARQKLLQQRELIWHGIRGWTASVPRRNRLLIAGDMNACLLPQPPYVGPGIALHSTGEHPDQASFQSMVVASGLAALNTWGRSGRPACTYLMQERGGVQLDFLLTRLPCEPAFLRAAALLQAPVVHPTGFRHVPLNGYLPKPRRPHTAVHAKHWTAHNTRRHLEAHPQLGELFKAAIQHRLPHAPVDGLEACIRDAWHGCVRADAGPQVSPARAASDISLKAYWQAKQDLRAAWTQSHGYVAPLVWQISHAPARRILALLPRAVQSLAPLFASWRCAVRFQA